MTPEQLAVIVQALLLTTSRPMTEVQLLAALGTEEGVSAAAVRQGVQLLPQLLAPTALELVEVASGYRLQIRSDLTPYVGRMLEERPQRASRALMETLALIVYRQPITRGEIEEIRGVAVSSPIMRTLQDRDWIRIAGHREVPGRPALWVTTKQFLDAMGVRKISDLPSLVNLESQGWNVSLPDMELKS